MNIVQGKNLSVLIRELIRETYRNSFVKVHEITPEILDRITDDEVVKSLPRHSLYNAYISMEIFGSQGCFSIHYTDALREDLTEEEFLTVLCHEFSHIQGNQRIFYVTVDPLLNEVDKILDDLFLMIESILDSDKDYWYTMGGIERDNNPRQWKGEYIADALGIALASAITGKTVRCASSFLLSALKKIEGEKKRLRREAFHTEEEIKKSYTMTHPYPDLRIEFIKKIACYMETVAEFQIKNLREIFIKHVRFEVFRKALENYMKGRIINEV